MSNTFTISNVMDKLNFHKIDIAHLQATLPREGETVLVRDDQDRIYTAYWVRVNQAKPVTEDNAEWYIPDADEPLWIADMDDMQISEWCEYKGAQV